MARFWSMEPVVAHGNARAVARIQGTAARYDRHLRQRPQQGGCHLPLPGPNHTLCEHPVGHRRMATVSRYRGVPHWFWRLQGFDQLHVRHAARGGSAGQLCGHRQRASRPRHRVPVQPVQSRHCPGAATGRHALARVHSIGLYAAGVCARRHCR